MRPAAVVATDPERVDELTEEFRQKVEFICRNYDAWKHIGVSPSAINRARSDLRAAVSSGAAGQLERLHPMLELSINLRATELAGATSAAGEVVAVKPEHIAQAIDEEVEKPALRGRSRDINLVTHIEQLMVLIWDTVGAWPAMSKHRGKIYQPQATNIAGQTLVLLAKLMEPKLTTTAIAETAIRVSRRLKDRPVRFRDFNPFWDASFDAEAAEFRRSGTVCGRLEILSPIFRRISPD